MKTKLTISLVILVGVAGASWLGRSLYDRHQGLITLHVRDLPVGEVAAIMSRQSGKAVLVPSTLDGRLSLDLQRVPLAEAIEKMCQEVGAGFTLYHAVHTTPQALDKLKAALRDRTALSQAGWTNVAPSFHAPELAGPELAAQLQGIPDDALPPGARRMIVENSGGVVVRREAYGSGSGKVVLQSSPGAPASEPSPDSQQDVNVQIGNADAAKGKLAAGKPVMRMVTMTRDAHGNMQQEVWSPEVISMENNCAGGLRPEQADDTSEAAAQKLALEAKAQVTTFYALRRMPGGFSLPPGLLNGVKGGSGKMGRAVTIGGDGQPATGVPGALPDVEGMVRRAQAESFTKLTPEERVRRAQEKQSTGSNH